MTRRSRAERNFKGPFYILRHVRKRLKRDTGVLERGLGSVGDRSHPTSNPSHGRTLMPPSHPQTCEPEGEQEGRGGFGDGRRRRHVLKVCLHAAHEDARGGHSGTVTDLPEHMRCNEVATERRGPDDRCMARGVALVKLKSTFSACRPDERDCGARAQ